MKTDTTTFVILTPTGRSAIASIRVSGPAATNVVDHCFTSIRGKSLEDISIRQIAYGHWGETSEGEGVVVARLDHETIEIHCHGGVTAVAAIAADLCNHGAIEKSPDAFVLDRPNQCPITGEAELAMLDASTHRASLVLLDQFNGALAEEIKAIRSTLSSGDATSAGKSLDSLLATWPLGNHLTQPWKVVLAGPPNVGKSSLINALVGFERSIVFDQPGTTRDVVTARTAMDGWPVELSDTAGIRTSTDQIEAEGVERARAQLAAADLVILVADPEHALVADDELIPATLSNVIHVWNKSDRQPPPAESWIATSAIAGQGIEELISAIVKRLVPNPPDVGEPVVFTVGHTPRHPPLAHSQGQ
ncbi:MAG: GTPase, partial [Planctomycetota bacterium]